MAPSLRIGVVAPGTRIEPELAARLKAFAADSFLDRAPEIVVHPQCFLSAGHFAGDDDARLKAFVEYANDPALDAIWFARGGYGACRIAEAALAQLNGASRVKTYLGYSDNGAVLGGLYARGYENIAHGPLPIDMTRAGGEGAVKRALACRSMCVSTPMTGGRRTSGRSANHFRNSCSMVTSASRPGFRACSTTSSTSDFCAASDVAATWSAFGPSCP
jgi:muramoyltetrapeptide carboxypeptidase LdcA involved in peptidoglycan recycling